MNSWFKNQSSSTHRRHCPARIASRLIQSGLHKRPLNKAFHSNPRSLILFRSGQHRPYHKLCQFGKRLSIAPLFKAIKVWIWARMSKVSICLLWSPHHSSITNPWWTHLNLSKKNNRAPVEAPHHPNLTSFKQKETASARRRTKKIIIAIMWPLLIRWPIKHKATNREEQALKC